MNTKTKWNLLCKHIMPLNEQKSYSEFLCLQEQSPAKAIAQLDGVFIYLSFKRMKQLALLKGKERLPQYYFQMEKMNYAWTKIRETYNCTMKELNNAHKFIIISEKKFIETIFSYDVEKAWLKLQFIFDLWYANHTEFAKSEKSSENQGNESDIKNKKVEQSTANLEINKFNPEQTNDKKFRHIEKNKNKTGADFTPSVSEYYIKADSKEFHELDTYQQSSVTNILDEDKPTEKESYSQTEKSSSSENQSLEKHFFSYLLELTQLRESVIRDYTKYESYWNLKGLKKISGCYLEDDSKEEDTLFSIHRPVILQTEKTPPTIPEELREWIDFNVKDEEATIRFLKHVKDVNRRVTQDFNDNSLRVQQGEAYSEKWNEWAKNLRNKNKQLRLYDDFFELVSRFEREGESLEFIYGRGIFTWKHQDPKIGDIQSPLLTIPLELELDAKKGIIAGKKIDDLVTINRDMFSGVRFPNTDKLENVYQRFSEMDILEPDADLYKEFINTISSQGAFYGRGQRSITIEQEPMIYDEAAFILRKKNTRVLRSDLESFLQLIEKEKLELNEAIQSLIYQEVKYPLKDTESSSQNNLLLGRNELYFPLPANEQQVQIIERLQNNYGVTVQGPPGTGKTHTIANLVSHFLAEGKRVLITSQKENALKVLREKIPEEIRDLCVPVLGGSRESLQEIEQSINIINEKLGELNIPELKKNVQDNLTEFDQSKRIEMELRSQLQKYAEKEGAILEYDGKELLRYEVAKLLSENTVDYRWIKDSVQLNGKFPLAEPDFKELWKYRNELRRTDLELVNMKLPHLNQDIKNTEDFEQLIDELDFYHEKQEDTEGVFKQYNLPKSQDKLEKIDRTVGVLIGYQTFLSNADNEIIFNELSAGGDRKQHWLDLYKSLHEDMEEVFQQHNKLIIYEIQLTGKKITDVKNDLILIKKHLQSGKKLTSFLFSMFKGKNLQYLIKEPVIDGRPIETLDDISIIETYISYRELKKGVEKKYNRNMKIVDGPSIDEQSEKFPYELEESLKVLDKIMEIFDVMQDIENSVNTQLLNLLKEDSQLKLKEKVKQAKHYLDYKEWQKQYNKEINLLETFEKQSQHPIFSKFKNALRKKNVTLWSEAIQELEEVRELQHKAIRFQELISVFESTLPLTKKEIINSLNIPLSFPEDYLDAFEAKRLQTWLDETKNMNQGLLNERLKKEKDTQKKLIKKIVSDATWSSQLNRITDEQKRALSSWKSFIKRVGKGTGKYAHQYLANARKQMKVAQHAIPVWIMPITQVMENFPIENEKFDVVIFDESSQCDIYAVNVLSRGKKSIVVGDDEQISPESIGVKREDVNDLVHRYIPDIPNAHLFDGNISLYEIAEQVFPKEGKLMLREHFRCVPEIIQFSNDLSYGGEMIPLRLPVENEKINPPVTAIHIQDGYNDLKEKDINYPEAERIANDISEMVQDNRFNEQSFGVISLQGTKQHKVLEKLIREKIGDAEFVNREIICGNSYDLQGDERDVILLSTVVAPNRNFRALTKLEDKQRYNVAASRARNQLRLYHSVTTSHLNPDDLRNKLLNYCQNPTRVKQEIEDINHLVESPFEKDVIQLILGKGYRVTPQVKVGNYRIDLVVEGVRNRLAVEVDGEKWHGPEQFEADMQRQGMLERAGWEFWRVRGREFYLDREEAMKSLWETLDELDIKPRKEMKIH